MQSTPAPRFGRARCPRASEGLSSSTAGLRHSLSLEGPEPGGLELEVVSADVDVDVEHSPLREPPANIRMMHRGLGDWGTGGHYKHYKGGGGGVLYEKISMRVQPPPPVFRGGGESTDSGSTFRAEVSWHKSG